jgi:hypothetical protein
MMTNLVVGSCKRDEGGLKIVDGHEGEDIYLFRSCSTVAGLLISPAHPHIGYCFNVHRFHATASAMISNVSHVKECETP